MNTMDHYFRKDQDAFYRNERGELRCRSVHYESQFRFDKAREEAGKKVVSPEQISHYINEFLGEIDVMPVKCPKMDPAKIDYAELKSAYKLENEGDIIWLKFTTDGYVGVVAQSNDINFDFPFSAEAYNKRKGQNWQFNTSGIIVHKLGKQWDQTFVLVFPLKKIKNTRYSRHEIETAVGNYLIDKGVPILDYYSHNY